MARRLASLRRFHPISIILLTIFLEASRLGRSLCSVTWPLLAPFAIPDRAMVIAVWCCDVEIERDGDEIWRA